jgi:hypothetical protein
VQEENHEWLLYLTDGIGKRCAGRDPMSIPVEVLTASGHPPRRTRQLVNAFAKGADGDVLGLEGIREYGDIRRHCPAVSTATPLRFAMHHDQLSLRPYRWEATAQSATGAILARVRQR